VEVQDKVLCIAKLDYHLRVGVIATVLCCSQGVRCRVVGGRFVPRIEARAEAPARVIRVFLLCHRSVEREVDPRRGYRSRRSTAARSVVPSGNQTQQVATTEQQHRSNKEDQYELLHYILPFDFPT